LHGPDDVLVPGAAAQVARQPFADLLLVGVGVVAQQVDRRDDHTGGTEAALQGVQLVERALNGVQCAVGAGQPLDGGNRRAVGLQGQHGAALDAVPRLVGGAHQHRAGTTVAGVAADDGTGLANRVAQVVDQQRARFDVVDVPTAVDRHFNARGLASGG
jgi:hypothetical protein